MLIFGYVSMRDEIIQLILVFRVIWGVCCYLILKRLMEIKGCLSIIKKSVFVRSWGSWNPQICSQLVKTVGGLETSGC